MKLFYITLTIICILTGYIISVTTYEPLSNSTIENEIKRVADAFDYYNERRFN